MRKKLISLTLLLCMAVALCLVSLPPREAWADRTPISTVVATSNISSILVDGGAIQSPTFSTSQGTPAYINGGSGFGYWWKKEGDTWVNKTGSFSPGTWQFRAQLRIDSSAYVLSNPSLTVDGSAWVVNLPTLTVYDNVCYVSIRSKEYTVQGSITSVAITIAEPREDYQPSFEAEHSDDSYTVDNVNWYALYTQEYMDRYDHFYGGNQFRVEIRLAPKSGYMFTGATSGRINGMNASVTLQGDGKLLLQYTFTCPYFIRFPQVYLSQPLPGEAPDYSAEYPSDAHYAQGTYDSNVFQDDIAWQDVTTGYYMVVGTDVFEGGHDYEVNIYLTPSSGYVFSSNAQGMINGEDAVTEKRDSGQVWLRHTFHCNLPVPPVSVTVKAPAVGAHPDYDPVFPADAHCYASYSEGDWKNGVCWVDLTRKAEDGYGFMDPNSSVFEACHQYKVYIKIWSDSGYVITDGFSCTINGTAAIDEGYDEYARTFPTLSAGGWKKDSKGWWYQRADGTYPKNQWEKINGKWYHFDASGYMQTGWLKLGGTWYYLDSSGAMVTGWQHIGGQWYYFNSSGAMLTGWQTIGGQKYWFNASGAMQKGWQNISGKWYYFNSSGAMLTGWQTIGGQKYYLSTDGSMVTGLQKVDGKWYYFESSGALSTASGWRKIGTKWYYFDSNGAAQTGWQAIGGKWYYFESTGVMATGWKQLSGKWYYLGADGAMATGWRLIDNVWYYFETSGVMLANTTKTINGKAYTFNASGVCTNP